MADTEKKTGALKVKEELKRVRQDRGELKKIKDLVGAGGHVSVRSLENIEKKFVQPAKLDGHKYRPGEHTLRLVSKAEKESELSKIKGLIKKEGTDLSRIKELILSRREGAPAKAKEVSLRQIEKMERTKLAGVERDSRVVDQRLSSSLEPAEGELVGGAGGVPENNAERPSAAGATLPGNSVPTAPLGEKSNLNPAAIPISEGQGETREGPKTAAQPEKKQGVSGTRLSGNKMAKEEAVDNRPLGEIIAEEEAKEREKLAKEIEKEAAEDAKKATEKKGEKPAGKWAGFLSHLKFPSKEKPAQAQQAQPQQAQPQVQVQAQPAAAAPLQGGGQTQIVLQVPSISSSPGKVTVQEEVDLRKLTMDVEKLGAEFSALKDTKTQSDERLQRIAEDVGELRSLFFQREEAFRDTQSTAEKLKSTVEEIEPEKFLKALHKSESEIMLGQTKIEKLERISDESGRQIKEMRTILENVKGIENLKELLKEINAKSSKVEEMRAEIERSTNKVEKLYVEVDRKLGEFNVFRAKVITLDELTKELVKIVDEAKVKLDDTPNKSEFAVMEKGVQEELKQATDSLESVKQQLVSQLSDIQSKAAEITSGMENFKQETRMQVTAVQMQLDRELAELRQQALLIIDAVKEEVQRNTINIDELKRMESYVELDRKIREHSLPSVNQPYKPEAGVPAGIKRQPVEEPKPVPRSISPGEIRASVQELEKRRAELAHLLDFLEDEYHRGIISERSYRESKESAKSRLVELNRLIEIKGKVLRDLPHSAGADDARDLYFSPERVKREVDEARETPVSRLLDVQERFDKINDMLSLLGERKQAAEAPEDKGEAPKAGIRRSHLKKQDTKHIITQVKAIRRSLDDKLDAAREHEHKIRQLRKEKERLKRYHPVISKGKGKGA